MNCEPARDCAEPSAVVLLDLDEPIADHVQHPELSADPRYRLLTARLLLSHRAGLLNWAYEYEDGRLAFDHDPDTRFSYSGAGVELAARYAEARTGKSLRDLAREHVFTPLGIEEVSLWMRGGGEAALTLTLSRERERGQSAVWPTEPAFSGWLFTDELETGPPGHYDGFGYSWWLNSELDAVAADGRGGQFMLVNREEDLTLVTRRDTGNSILGFLVFSGFKKPGHPADIQKLYRLIRWSAGILFCRSGRELVFSSHC